jgi:hypothetical protein
MPKEPQGQKRCADVMGNAVHAMRIATGRDLKKFGGPEVAGKTYRQAPRAVPLLRLYYGLRVLNSALGDGGDAQSKISIGNADVPETRPEKPRSVI